MGSIKFGTDGWRAVIAEDFTFCNVERVAQAAADYWQTQAPPGVERKIAKSEAGARQLLRLGLSMSSQVAAA